MSVRAINEPVPGKTGRDRRIDERFPLYRVEARMGTAEGIVLGMVRDISRSGAFIETHANPQTTEFQVTFLLKDLNPPLQIRTLAQWVRAEANGIGVRFIAIDADDFDRLTKLAACQVGVY